MKNERYTQQSSKTYERTHKKYKVVVIMMIRVNVKKRKKKKKGFQKTLRAIKI